MVPSHSQDVYYNYLYTINPIAERIRKDVDATKDAYQSLWYDLSVDEQNKILEESIISPETVLKYSKYKKSNVSWPLYERILSIFKIKLILIRKEVISKTIIRPI